MGRRVGAPSLLMSRTSERRVSQYSFPSNPFPFLKPPLADVISNLTHSLWRLDIHVSIGIRTNRLRLPPALSQVPHVHHRCPLLAPVAHQSSRSLSLPRA